MTKIHKRKKVSREKGSKTAFWGNRKRHKKSGHRGGMGMSGAGKHAAQKKTLLLNLYGNNYLGRRGVTSRPSFHRKNLVISLDRIEEKIDNFVKEGKAKLNKGVYELNLEGYKILSQGNLVNKFSIKAKSASKNAVEKIKKAGSNIELAESEELTEENKSSEQKVKIAKIKS